MAKLTVHHEPKTPTAKAIESANQLVYVTDAKGRKLGLRRLDFLEEFRVMEAVGPDLAENQAYMRMLTPLLYVAEINDDPVEIPRNKRQVEALIQRVGREGFLPVIEGIATHFSADQKQLETKIKNSSGTPDSESVSGS